LLTAGTKDPLNTVRQAAVEQFQMLGSSGPEVSAECCVSSYATYDVDEVLFIASM